MSLRLGVSETLCSEAQKQSGFDEDRRTVASPAPRPLQRPTMVQFPPSGRQANSALDSRRDQRLAESSRRCTNSSRESSGLCTVWLIRIPLLQPKTSPPRVTPSPASSGAGSETSSRAAVGPQTRQVQNSNSPLVAARELRVFPLASPAACSALELLLT